ncbi:putative hemolysin [Thiofilum flexile]|uniref:putative hemolysin n=1 Tax=Thiofilum flexile TaxID=125627 RepID=UPI00037F36B4|nr:DUF333 domain-containing protein [Thiofilum flexile]
MFKTISTLAVIALLSLSSAAFAMGNPASINCLEKGGKLKVIGEVGYCQLPNGARCEEWALFRGECPAKKPPVAPKPPQVGGARDAHGCLSSAGYAWCASTNQCERPWELAKQKNFPNTPAGFQQFCHHSGH